MNAETFCEHFSTFAESPNGVEILRKMILQLAVQGKLVTQKQADEPASVLLDRLRDVRREKSRRSNHSAKRSEAHSALPFGWEWVRLNELGEFCGGGTPSMKVAEYWGGSIPWVSPKDMKVARVSTSELRITDAALKGTRIRLIPKGSILVVARSGILKRTLPVSINDIECTVNQDLKVLIPFLPEVSEYIRLMLRGHEAIILETLIKGGVTVQSLKYDEFEVHSFPLPPLAEQKRIVAKVDELMALCDELSSRQSAQREARGRLVAATLDRLVTNKSVADFLRIGDTFDLLFDTPTTIPQLREAILQLAVQGQLVPQDSNDEPAADLRKRLADHVSEMQFAKRSTRSKPLPPLSVTEIPFDLPNDWEWVRFGELAAEVEYGTSQKASEIGGEVPVLRMNAIREGKVILEETKFVSTAINDLPRLYLKNGDILFNRTNSFELVGKSGVFNGPDDKYTFASYLIRASLLPELSPAFVVLAMNARYFRKTQIEPEVTQQCGQANFNGTKLRSTLIPLPPLAEQKRIVAKVNQLLALCDALETGLLRAESVSESLLSTLICKLNSN